MMRQEEVVQGAFHMKAQNSRGGKDKKNNKWRNKKPEGSNKQQGETFPPCLHCKKKTHQQKNVKEKEEDTSTDGTNESKGKSTSNGENAEEEVVKRVCVLR